VDTSSHRNMFKYYRNSWLWPYNLWEENGYHVCKLLSSAVTTDP